MPATRSKPETNSGWTVSRARKHVKTRMNVNGIINMGTPVDDMPRDLTLCSMAYPTHALARAAFRTCDGKKLTKHQWSVYDFARTIPRGRVVTYGALCKALGEGSPRSVGSALRHNPFTPFIPCHRVIASNFYIGGFFGEWGTSSCKKNGIPGKQCQRKVEMLATEGVGFTVDGYLADESLVWTG